MKRIFCLVFSFFSFCLFAQEWKKLDSLAYIYVDYKPDSALLISQKAVFLCEKEKTKNSPEYANCLGTLAYNYYKLKNKKLADSLFKVSLQIFEQRQENVYTDEYPTVLNLYGIFNETILNYKVSEEAYNKALSVRLTHLKQDSIRCADLFNNLGSLMHRTGKMAQAEQYQRIAIRLYKMRLNKKDNSQNRENYYNSIRNLCKILESKGDFLQAEKKHQQLLDEMSKIYGMNNEKYINALSDMGVFYGKAGKIEEAEKIFIECGQAMEKLKGKKDKDYGRILNNRAALYTYHKIKFDEAEILLREVEKIHNSFANEVDMEYLSMKNNLGMLYLQQKNYEKAEKEFLYILPVLEKKLGKESLIYAITLNNLAGVYENMNKLSASESLYKESVSIKKNIYGENSVQAVHTLANLAKVYFLKKEYTNSEKAYLNSLDILRKHYPVYHADILTRLIDLTNFYIYTNNTERASLYLQEAQNIIKQYYPEKYNQYYKFSALKSYSALYYRKNKPDSALFFVKKAIEYIYQDLKITFKTLSEDEKIKYSERFANSTFNQFYAYLMNCSFNKTEQQENLIFAYQVTMNNKGFVLNSMQDIRSKILSYSDTSLKNKYFEWKKLKDTYAKISKLSVQEIEKNKINPESLLTRLNSIEKEMAYKSYVFAKYNQDGTVKYKEVQDKLNRNEAALEIIRAELKNAFWLDKDSLVYIALIMKKNTPYPDMVILPYGNSLETQYFVNYRRSIQNKSYDELSYNAFWKPIKEKLKSIKTVYFSPDGIYHQINLNTLQNPETKKYVSDEIQVINVTNTKDILNKRTYTTKNNYLIGNPKFDLQLKTEESNEKPKQERTFEGFFEGVSQLEGAEKEVKQISVILPNAKTTVGTEATEEYVKSIKNPRILHIATHGYFKKGQYQSSTQAMLNAGLLFAGVVDYDRMDIRPLDKEDGKLTAFEVMNMELDSTELVVLSACETGLGQASKEGVYGLQRAFKVAGAQSIIMSLWKVNDEATQLLMTKFYENWQKKGMDKRKAFETAQKEIRKKYKEPYYWGAFVMIE